jgi:hypothetical protein
MDLPLLASVLMQGIGLHSSLVIQAIIYFTCLGGRQAAARSSGINNLE